MVRKLFGGLVLLMGVALLSWIVFNFLIQMQPEAKELNPIPAIVVGATFIFIGTKWLRGATVLSNPKVGFLNLLGEDGQQLLTEDKNSIGRFFADSEKSTGAPPSCDVLFLYCQISNDGIIRGTQSSLRKIIRDSRASIAVVAAQNSDQAYVAAGKNARFRRVNLVMTMDRKGESFGRFFQALFEDMLVGTSMPVAWVKLAPQGGQMGGGKDTPDTIFACAVDQLVFKR